jgi:hypothetical protein
VARGSWGVPPEELEWERIEWRHYETDDSHSQGVAFYQSAMPQDGWQQNIFYPRSCSKACASAHSPAAVDIEIAIISVQ